ncbi:hypothetical protein H0920_11110 [Acinetobacter sp. C_4_1]|nr:hypothetical protein [Acinetobacter sp. F_3_1]MCT8098573.1 hypothetical protein [Acinetobacter sp. C_3_1]MCT8101644.1 hypothetical protein [Acinetobacter sp. C_4_1]MCT8134987.1 hypothetical protein [Acinetobacter sp. T_3_1]
MIGQEFGHCEYKNTAEQLVSHAILGASPILMVETRLQAEVLRLRVRQQQLILRTNIMMEKQRLTLSLESLILTYYQKILKPKLGI